MNGLKAGLISLMMLSLAVTSVGAEEVAELKAMLEQLKADYEAKIQALEARIEQLEDRQEERVSRLKVRVKEEIEDEIKAEIEEEVKEKATQVEYFGRYKAPVGAGGLVVRNPFGFGNVSLGGYFDTEYRDLNNAESTFQQHRWIINIGAQITERMRFNSEYEIEYGGSNAPTRDGEDKVEQAYGDFLINDMINLRAGAILTPFGRYNLYHDSDLQDLTDRPLVARRIIPTTWTEAGYGFFGEFNPVIGAYEDLQISYELYAINGLNASFSDTGLRGARGSLKTDNNDNRSLVGRLVLSPWVGQEVALSGYTGEYNGTGNALTGMGVDTLNTLGPLEFITEYAYFDIDESPTSSSDLANYFQGAYAQLNYHFWPEFLNETFLGRGFEDPTFTLIGRYDWAKIHDDGDSTTGENEERRYTFGMNYRPTESFVFKFEYQLNETENETLEAGDGDGFVSSMAFGF